MKAPNTSTSTDAPTSATPALREVSVMAWIEDPYGQVLLVKQASAKKLWSFPGGRLLEGETLHQALRREVKEETGLIVDVASLIDYYDRPEKQSVTFLFRVILKPNNHDNNPKLPTSEIESFGFRAALPSDSTPSLKFFWARAQQSFEPLSILGP